MTPLIEAEIVATPDVVSEVSRPLALIVTIELDVQATKLAKS